MKTTTPAKTVRANDFRTAGAARQIADEIGSAAIAMGHGDYFEGTIVHANPVTRVVVIASGARFYVCKRVVYGNATWLDLRHTAHEYGAAIDAASSSAMVGLAA